MKKKRRFAIPFALSAVLTLMSACSPDNIDTFGGSGSGMPGGATSGSAANIAISLSPTAITGGVLGSDTTTVTATVRDAFSNLVSGATVSFSVSNGTAGAFSAASATTDASGIATVTFTANVVDLTVTITSTVSTSTGATYFSRASLTIGSPPPPTPASIAISINPLQVDILQQATATITVLDANSNPANGVTIDLAITVGQVLATLDPAYQPDDAGNLGDAVTVTTNASGQATATIYIGGASGVVTMSATWTSLTPPTPPTITKTASLSITSEPSDVTVDLLPPTITVGGTSAIQATVRNAAGGFVPDGTEVSFVILAGNPAAGVLDATATTVSGVATASFTAADIACSIAIQASAGTDPNIVTGSAVLTIQAAATNSIEFVDATPPEIGIVGSGVQEYSFVKFLVMSTAGTGQSGVSVDFLLNGPNGSYIGPNDADPTVYTVTTNQNGEAIVTLHAGNVPGPARIVATVTLSGGGTIQTSSGNIAIAGALPDDLHFGLATSTFNLDGPVAGYGGCYGVTSTIMAFLADRYGDYNILTGTQVTFISEAGAVDAFGATDSTGYANVTFRTQSPAPDDVAPLTGEPRYAIGTRTYNPRDGWVTVQAMTTGSETFRDLNGNGIFDGSDIFTDLPEPFLDRDDSGARENNEEFFDWPSYVQAPNNPGQYDDSNGGWDIRTMLFRDIKLVFTGPPNVGPNTSRIEDAGGSTGPISILQDGYHDFIVYVSDINLNPPIAGTTINVESSKGTLEVIGGLESLPDIISDYGPYELWVRLTNNSTSATPVTPILKATISWPGHCGPLDFLISYPGIITLEPAPPAAPTGVTATVGTPGTNEINIGWTVATGATSYNIYYGTTPGISTSSTQIAGVTSPHTFTGTAGTKYYFVVTAVGPGGESAISSEVSGTLPPDAPTGVNLTAGGAGSGQISVGWTASAGAASYNIYCGTSPGVTTSSLLKVVGATNPQMVSGLTSGTTYYFVVTAVNAGGESAVSAEASAAAP